MSALDMTRCEGEKNRLNMKDEWPGSQSLGREPRASSGHLQGDDRKRHQQTSEEAAGWTGCCIIIAVLHGGLHSPVTRGEGER